MRASAAGQRPDRIGEDLLRRGLLWLSILGTIGTALELVLLRHWDNPLELIPFVALGVLAVAIVLVARRPTARSIRAGRALAAAVLVTSVVGVLVHVRFELRGGAARLPLHGLVADDARADPMAARGNRHRRPVTDARAGGARVHRTRAPDRHNAAPSHATDLTLSQSSVVSVRKWSRTTSSIVGPVNSSAAVNGLSTDEVPTDSVIRPGSTMRR